MKRILLLYAKLNPGIQYVQGMNEILAPLYFVFRTSTDPESSVRYLYFQRISYYFITLKPCFRVQFFFLFS